MCACACIHACVHVTSLLFFNAINRMTWSTLIYRSSESTANKSTKYVWSCVHYVYHLLCYMYARVLNSIIITYMQVRMHTHVCPSSTSVFVSTQTTNFKYMETLCYGVAQKVYVWPS